jgi:hypothetical protein
MYAKDAREKDAAEAEQFLAETNEVFGDSPWELHCRFDLAFLRGDIDYAHSLRHRALDLDPHRIIREYCWQGHFSASMKVTVKVQSCNSIRRLRRMPTRSYTFTFQYCWSRKTETKQRLTGQQQSVCGQTPSKHSQRSSIFAGSVSRRVRLRTFAGARHEEVGSTLSVGFIRSSFS